MKHADIRIDMQQTYVYMETTKVESDFMNDDYFLFSTSSFLAVYSKIHKTIYRIAGSKVHGFKDGEKNESKFNGITDFIQTCSDILVADMHNHCIRISSRYNLHEAETLMFAGLCETPGSTDGDIMSARFIQPRALALYESTLYVADATGLRKIHDSETVTTVVDDGVTRHGLQLHPIPVYVYFTANTYVGRINLNNSYTEIVSGSKNETGFTDGSLLDARVSSCHGFQFLNQHVILLSDRGRDTLRVIDFSEQKTSTICVHRQQNESQQVLSNTNGDINNCELVQPRSLDIKVKSGESELYKIADTKVIVQQAFSEVIISTALGIMSLQLFKGKKAVKYNSQ